MTNDEFHGNKVGEINKLIEIVRAAWSTVPPAPKEDMKAMAFESTEDAVRAFTGVAPMDIDTESVAFAGAEGLFELPPHAAATYLGTFILSLLKGLELQARVGFFDDVVTRAHTLTFLTRQESWSNVIRKYLSSECQRAVEAVALYLAANPTALPLDQRQIDILKKFSTQSE